MLDAFIIEEIRRRESEQGREERPSVQLPVPPPPPAHSESDPEKPAEGGVVIIDYTD
jgi:hypothetical protein